MPVQGPYRSSVRSAMFAENGRLLVSVDSSRTIKVWNVAEGSLQYQIEGYNAGYLAVSGDGMVFASGEGPPQYGLDAQETLSEIPDSSLAGIKVWRAQDGQLLHSLAGRSNLADPIAFMPDSKNVAVNDIMDRAARFLDVSDGSTVRMLPYPGGFAAFSSDGQFFIARTSDELGIYRIADGSLVYKIDGSKVSLAVFSLDGQWLATNALFVQTGLNTRLELRRAVDGSLVQVLFESPKEQIESVAFSPDSKLVAGSASQDLTIKVWRVSDGQLLYTLSGHKDRVTYVAFSPVGGLLASGSTDQEIKLWRVSDGKEVRTLQSVSTEYSYVYALAFSPNGQLLASGDKEGHIKLWRVQDGRLVRILNGHRSDIKAITFSADGKWLASSDYEGVALWQVKYPN